MTTATLTPSLFDVDLGRAPGSGAAPGASARGRDGQGRLTLDGLLVGVWEGLNSGHAAMCPVCGGAMVVLLRAGVCRDCGASLS